MASIGTVQENEDAQNAQLDRIAEEIRRIQPGWWRLAAELGAVIAFLCVVAWDDHHSQGHNSGLLFFGGLASAVFFRDLKLRFRLQAVLYGLLWHG